MKKILLALLFAFLFIGLQAQDKLKHDQFFMTIETSANFQWNPNSETWDTLPHSPDKRTVKLDPNHIIFYSFSKAVPFIIDDVITKDELFTYACHSFINGKKALIIVDLRRGRKLEIKLVIDDKMTIYNIIDIQ